MKRGFYTIMAAQFFSSLADNALFVAAVELLRAGGGGEWQRAALVPMFALFYVILAPWVGAFADSRPSHGRAACCAAAEDAAADSTRERFSDCSGGLKRCGIPGDAGSAARAADDGNTDTKGTSLV